MSEPKYNVGQRVGVCSLEAPAIVIPDTVVIGVKYCDFIDETFEVISGPCVPGWYYAVEGSEWEFDQESLRPIDDDEYVDDLVSEELEA